MYGPERARARREDYNRTKCAFTNQLARNDIDTLMMRFGFNARQKDTVRDSCSQGLCLVNTLEGAGQLGEENFSKMMTLLKDRNVPAYNVWNGYKKSWFSDSDTGTMPVVTLQASSAYFTPKTGTKPVTMIEAAFEDMKLELSKVITDQEIVSMQQYFRISESDKLYIKNASLPSYQLLSKLERKHNFHSTNIASVYLWFGRSGNNRDALDMLAVYQARWITGEEPKPSTPTKYKFERESFKERAFYSMKEELSKMILDPELVYIGSTFELTRNEMRLIMKSRTPEYQLLSKLQEKNFFSETNIGPVESWFIQGLSTGGPHNHNAIAILAAYKARWITGEEPKSSTSFTYPKMFKVKPALGWRGRAFADMKEELSKVITDEEIVFMQGSFGMNEIDKRAIKNAHIPSYELLTRLQGKGEGGFHEGNIESVYSFLLERFENTDALRILAAYKVSWISEPELSEKIMRENLEPKSPQIFGEFSQTTTNDNAINSSTSKSMSFSTPDHEQLEHVLTLGIVEKNRLRELHAHDAEKTADLIETLCAMHAEFMEEVRLAIESEYEENISDRKSKTKERVREMKLKVAAKRRKNEADEEKESRRDKVLDRLASEEDRRGRKGRKGRKGRGDRDMTEEDENSDSGEEGDY